MLAVFCVMKTAGISGGFKKALGMNNPPASEGSLV